MNGRGVSPGDLGKRAVARFADGTERITGKVVCHSLVPSVLIVADDGTECWWRHDMCTVEEESL